jgi:hypothetical protein
LGRDAQSVAALQRKHNNFENDLVTLGVQVSIKLDITKDMLFHAMYVKTVYSCKRCLRREDGALW